jgi:hypothetical protein
VTKTLNRFAQDLVGCPDGVSDYLSLRLVPQPNP